MNVCLRLAGVLAAIAAVAPVSVSASGPAPDGPEPSIARLTMKQSNDDPRRLVVAATGLDLDAIQNKTEPERWQGFLRVRVVQKGDPEKADTPSLLGTYHRDGRTLRFVPRFPIEPGLRYRAEYDPHGRLNAKNDRRHPTQRMTAELAIERSSGPPTSTVTAVYPSRNVLPENLLRFYIHFSAPMSRGEAYRRIRLLDANGRPVADPFLELDEELWSVDGRRFTLLIDPGRIKRGLRPREEVGPVLMAGKSYVLAIDPGWLDARGRPLKSGYRKAFRANAADETSPDPKTWTIHRPTSGTRSPLEIRFPEPLDRALLDRMIGVRDEADRPIDGVVDVADEETVWRFTPESPWSAGAYHLLVGTELEDVAGNSVARPFEVDVSEPITRTIVRETVALPFRID